MRKGDNNGVMPSPYGGVKRGEAEHGAMAWLHWQCRGLCPPASVLCVCVACRDWHSWSPPDTGWGVQGYGGRGVEGGVWGGNGHHSERSIPFRPEKRGGTCITHSSSTIKNSSCGDLAIIMYVQAQWVHINFALLWLHTFKGNGKVSSRSVSQPYMFVL